MPLAQKWERFHARIKDGSILFCKNIETNDFSFAYILFNCKFRAMSLKIKERSEIEKSDASKQYDVIMFNHKFDKDLLLLSLEDDVYLD
jgi:hypothetical protein